MKPVEEDDDYDPMMEAHQSLAFNSYIKGPGSNIKSTMHTNQRRQEDGGFIKLHVSNIPASMTEEGLSNIFSDISDVRSVYINKTVRESTGSKWGFVELTNFNDASRAMAAIHNAEPHKLSVKFALTDKEKEAKKKHKESGYYTSTEDVPQPLMSNVPRGRGRPAGLQGAAPRNLKSTYLPPISHYDQDLQPFNGYSSGRFNPAENLGSHQDVANNTIRCTVTEDGSRSVSRACNSTLFYQDPKEVNMEKVRAEVNKRYHQLESNELYKFGTDETAAGYPVLKCFNCKCSARKRCYVCKAPFCSRNCIVKSWPIHQRVCSENSYFDKGSESSGSKLNGESNGHLSEDEKPSVNRRGFGNRNAGISRKPHIKKTDDTDTNFEKKPSTLKLSVSHNKREHSNSSKNSETSEEMLSKNVSTKEAAPSPEDFIKFTRTSEVTSVPEVSNLPVVIWNFLPADRFTQLSVTINLSENEYWTTKASVNLQMEIMNDLSNYCTSAEAMPVTKPIVNNKCAVLFQGDWYRGKILEVLPEMVVRLFDYGNKEIVSQSDIRVLPTILTKIPPQAVCIRLANGTSRKYKNMQLYSLIDVKPVSKEGEFWVVHVKGENYPQEKLSTSPITKPPSKKLSASSISKALPSQEKLSPSPINKAPSSPESVNSKKVPFHQLSSVQTDTAISQPVESIKPPAISSPESVKLPECSKTPEPEQSPSSSSGFKKSAFFSKFKKQVSLIPEDCPLPFDKFSKVTLAVAVSSSEYWVHNSEKLPNLYLMCSQLDSCASQTVVKPKLGEIYVKMYSDVWCRARVSGLNPLKVFYLDFGNEEETQAKELRPVPVEFYGIPPYAFKIKLADGTSRKYYNLEPEECDEISVKPARQLQDKTLLVLVEGEQYSNVALQSSVRVKHVMDEVTSKMTKVNLVVNKVFHDDFIACSLIIHGVDFLDKLSSKIDGLDLKPVSGEETTGSYVVCEGQDGTRGRGYIMFSNKDEVRVALTDLAQVVIASSLITTPSDIASHPDAGVRLSLDSPARKFEKGEKLVCLISSRQGNELIVNVKNASESGESVGGCIGIWTPRVEEAGLPAFSIASGSLVVISAFHSPRSMYVQSDDFNGREMLSTILQDTAAHTLNCPDLDHNPYTGEVLACRFGLDGLYYRAQVLMKKGEKYIVIYLDFGNTAEVGRSDFKLLENSLKMVPCCAIKVGLAGVDRDILNPTTASFLNDLLSNTQLFLSYDNEDLSQVKLTTKDGLDLSSKIMSLLDPNWKSQLETGQDPTGGEIFVSSDIKYTEWIEGSTVDVVILDFIGTFVMLGLNSSDGTLDYMCSDFSKSVCDYCESFAPNFSYNPRFNEICLVKFDKDDLWYRAVCCKCNKTTSNVMFIDFGNRGEVAHTDIRPITPEFASALSILKRIHIYGIPDKVDDSMVEKVNALFPKDCTDSYEAIVVEERCDGNVVLFFPHVAEAAAKIGLPQIKYP